MKTIKVLKIAAFVSLILLVAVIVFHESPYWKSRWKLQYSLLKEEPQEVALEKWEVEFLENSEAEAEFWNGRAYRIEIPKGAYLAAKAFELETGFPRERLLATCWTENQLKSSAVTSLVGATGICQVIPKAFKIYRHSDTADIYDLADNMYAAGNYLITTNVGWLPWCKSCFVSEFAFEAPLWNAHKKQAETAWRAAESIKKEMRLFRKRYG